MAPALGGGTQDTDFNKGFTKGMFMIFFLAIIYCPGSEVVPGLALGLSKVLPIFNT